MAAMMFDTLKVTTKADLAELTVDLVRWIVTAIAFDFSPRPVFWSRRSSCSADRAYASIGFAAPAR